MPGNINTVSISILKNLSSFSFSKHMRQGLLVSCIMRPADRVGGWVLQQSLVPRLKTQEGILQVKGVGQASAEPITIHAWPLVWVCVLPPSIPCTQSYLRVFSSHRHGADMLPRVCVLSSHTIVCLKPQVCLIPSSCILYCGVRTSVNTTSVNSVIPV